MASPSQNRRRSKNHSREASLDISFENTVQNKSLQPCDLNGFMDYLYYVERRAENLQFFLWYCDYVERWSRLPSSQRQMAPVWGPAEAAEAAQEDAEEAAAVAAASTSTASTTTNAEASISPPPPAASKQHVLHSRGPSASSSRSHSRHNLSIDTTNSGYPSGQYKPRTNSVASTATAASVSSMASVSSHLSSSSRLAASIHQPSDNAKLTNILTILENLPEAAEPVSAVEAPTSKHALSRSGEISPSTVMPNGSAGAPLDWQQQQQVQPFRDELGRVVRHYIAANGDRPLPDLFPPERLACLRAAKRTTHPSALLPAFLAAESALREQSFPMFVRNWCVGNIGRSSPRLLFVKIMAMVLFLVGLAVNIILIMMVGDKGPPGVMGHMADNLPRLASLAFWWPALTVLIAAWRRIDLLLHFRGQRLLRPWEIEDDGDDVDEEEAGSPMSSYSVDIEKELSGRSPTGSPKKYQRGHRHQASTSSTSSRIDPLRKASLQALGPRNDPQGEPWARRQRRTPFYRRLMAELWPATTGLGCRTVAVQHSGVRAMQNRAVWSAFFWAGLASASLAIITMFIPGPNVGPPPKY